MQFSLSQDEQCAVELARESVAKSYKIPCTGCGYCPLSQAGERPDVFRRVQHVLRARLAPRHAPVHHRIGSDGGHGPLRERLRAVRRLSAKAPPAYRHTEGTHVRKEKAASSRASDHRAHRHSLHDAMTNPPDSRHVPGTTTQQGCQGNRPHDTPTPNHPHTPAIPHVLRQI